MPRGHRQLLNLVKFVYSRFLLLFACSCDWWLFSGVAVLRCWDSNRVKEGGMDILYYIPLPCIHMWEGWHAAHCIWILLSKINEDTGSYAHTSNFKNNLPTHVHTQQPKYMWHQNVYMQNLIAEKNYNISNMA